MASLITNEDLNHDSDDKVETDDCLTIGPNSPEFLPFKNPKETQSGSILDSLLGIYVGMDSIYIWNL